MERDCCEFICGAPTTLQAYGIEQKKIDCNRVYIMILVCFSIQEKNIMKARDPRKIHVKSICSNDF